MPLEPSNTPSTSFNSDCLAGGEQYVSGTTYLFKVRTVAASGTSAFTNEAACTAAKAPTIATPVLSSPLNDAIVTGTATLSWNSVSGATSYGLEWGTSSNLTNSMESVIRRGSSATITMLYSGMTYYWRVRARTDTPSLNSPWTPVWHFTISNSLVLQRGVFFFTRDYHSVQFPGPGGIITGAILNASENPVHSATITFRGVDESGKIETFTYTFLDLIGGQVADFVIPTPPSVANVVFVSITIGG